MEEIVVRSSWLVDKPERKLPPLGEERAASSGDKESSDQFKSRGSLMDCSSIENSLERARAALSMGPLMLLVGSSFARERKNQKEVAVAKEQ